MKFSDVTYLAPVPCSEPEALWDKPFLPLFLAGLILRWIFTAVFGGLLAKLIIPTVNINWRRHKPETLRINNKTRWLSFRGGKYACDYQVKTSHVLRRTFIYTHDGACLGGYEISPRHRKSAKQVIIYFNPNGMLSKDRFYQRMQDSIETNSIVCSFDYRGTGLSRGASRWLPFSIQSQEDIITDGLAQVQRYLDEFPPEKILLYGASFGGAVASLVAERLLKRGAMVNGKHQFFALKVFNERSFSSLAKVASGWLRNPRANPDTLLGIVMYAVSLPIFSCVLELCGWPMHAGDAFQSLPPKKRRYLCVRYSKEDKQKNNAFDDPIIPHIASIHAHLKKERYGNKKRGVPRDVLSAPKMRVSQGLNHHLVPKKYLLSHYQQQHGDEYFKAFVLNDSHEEVASKEYYANPPLPASWSYSEIIFFPLTLMLRTARKYCSYLLGARIAKYALPDVGDNDGKYVPTKLIVNPKKNNWVCSYPETVSVKETAIQTHDGANLVGYEISPSVKKNNYQRYILHFNGHGMLSDSIFDELIREVGSMQCVSIAFDYRGTGLSQGIVRVQEDLITDGIAQVMRLLFCNKAISPNHIVLYGFSFGGAVASLVAERLLKAYQISVRVFNDRSFSSLAKVACGYYLRNPLGMPDTWDGILAYYAALPFVAFTLYFAG